MTRPPVCVIVSPSWFEPLHQEVRSASVGAGGSSGVGGGGGCGGGGCGGGGGGGGDGGGGGGNDGGGVGGGGPWSFAGGLDGLLMGCRVLPIRTGADEWSLLRAHRTLSWPHTAGRWCPPLHPRAHSPLRRLNRCAQRCRGGGLAALRGFLRRRSAMPILSCRRASARRDRKRGDRDRRKPNNRSDRRVRASSRAPRALRHDFPRGGRGRVESRILTKDRPL